jgi:hypothetical protein
VIVNNQATEITEIAEDREQQDSLNVKRGVTTDFTDFTESMVPAAKKESLGLRQTFESRAA